MRKLIILEHVSLDGYAADPNGGIGWVTYDKDMEKYSHDMTATADAELYGRVTYRMMESYWPTVPGDPSSDPDAVEYANWLNGATKYVVSHAPQTLTWPNSVQVGANLADEITKIKQQPGQNILMVGSLSLAQELMRLNLIDEYRINVNPILLGGGRPMFGSMEQALKLNLIDARKFACGVTGLRFEPAR